MPPRRPAGRLAGRRTAWSSVSGRSMPGAGTRSCTLGTEEWTAVAPSEEAVVREMPRCLREIAAGPGAEVTAAPTAVASAAAFIARKSGFAPWSLCNGNGGDRGPDAARYGWMWIDSRRLRISAMSAARASGPTIAWIINRRPSTSRIQSSSTRPGALYP
jgi:hypothetical protein